jgi:hypothetical protein
MNKMPVKNDNSWIGIIGTTQAICFNKKGGIVCTTLDAPNPVAYAVQHYPSIVKVTGITGNYDVAAMAKRSLDKKLFNEYQSRIKFK